GCRARDHLSGSRRSRLEQSAGGATAWLEPNAVVCPAEKVFARPRIVPAEIVSEGLRDVTADRFFPRQKARTSDRTAESRRILRASARTPDRTTSAASDVVAR